MEKHSPDTSIPVTRTIHSAGIVLVKKHEGKVKVLLVSKRITYNYAMFVNARYDPKDRRHIRDLFDGMTFDEKLDILSKNFDQIWYRMWLNNNRTAQFHIARNRFESVWLVDGGARLKTVISRSRSIERIWEVPKGRKKRPQETELECAIREFTEETGIDSAKYRVLPQVCVKKDFIDREVRYSQTYFAAAADEDCNMASNILLSTQVSELGAFKWMTPEEIRFVDFGGRLWPPIKKIICKVNKK